MILSTSILLPLLGTPGLFVIYSIKDEMSNLFMITYNLLQSIIILLLFIFSNTNNKFTQEYYILDLFNFYINTEVLICFLLLTTIITQIFVISNLKCHFNKSSSNLIILLLLNPLLTGVIVIPSILMLYITLKFVELSIFYIGLLINHTHIWLIKNTNKISFIILLINIFIRFLFVLLPAYLASDMSTVEFFTYYFVFMQGSPENSKICAVEFLAYYLVSMEGSSDNPNNSNDFGGGSSGSGGTEGGPNNNNSDKLNISVGKKRKFDGNSDDGKREAPHSPESSSTVIVSPSPPSIFSEIQRSVHDCWRNPYNDSDRNCDDCRRPAQLTGLNNEEGIPMYNTFFCWTQNCDAIRCANCWDTKEASHGYDASIAYANLIRPGDPDYDQPTTHNNINRNNRNNNASNHGSDTSDNDT